MSRDLRPHGPWDVKLRPGGLIDVEFIAQVQQLIHIHDRRLPPQPDHPYRAAAAGAGRAP